jgi:hypothetical protein
VVHNSNAAAVCLVVVMKVEALLDSQEFRDQLKMHSGVSNDQAQPSGGRPGHSFVVSYSKGGRKVFADVRDMKGSNLEDAMKGEMAFGSKMAGKGCAHMVMQYSARRDAAAAVFDP